MSIIINKKDWEKIFKEDIKAKLLESKIEFEKYKSTNKIVYLQQAGNKIFSVVENWLAIKNNIKPHSYQHLRDIVKNNRNDRILLSKAAQLHYFYYENVLRGEPQEFEDMYIEIYDIMKGRMSK